VKKATLFFVLCCVLLGCSHMKENVGHMGRYAIPDLEAEWIRNGEPIVFDGKEWHPQDRFDVLLDSEVYFLGEYQGVAFFAEKIDIRPYNKIFTKFGRNKFRIYKCKCSKRDDKGY